MVDGILLYWLLIFIILLIVNIAGNSTTFGMIAALWLLVLGLAIIITGVQLQTGINTAVSDTAQNITYVYEDVVLPFSTYAFIWGIFMIGLSMYMLIANGMKKIT